MEGARGSRRVRVRGPRPVWLRAYLGPRPVWLRGSLGFRA